MEKWCNGCTINEKNIFGRKIDQGAVLIGEIGFEFLDDRIKAIIENEWTEDLEML